MNPKVDTIKLGVGDRERARRFYEHGLGGAVDAGKSLVVSFGGNASRLVLEDWDAVARSVDIDPQSSGFRAFTLSYILDSADAVDAAIERATQNGGAITKEPKNAVWGYSAYVTDPDGYLWKIASSKRRPLLGRRGLTQPSNGRAIQPKEVPITIGVADMKSSKEFYEGALGLLVKKSYGSKFVMFSGQGDRSDLGMYPREALAGDAAVQPEGSGFRGFTLTHVADSERQVDQLLDRVERAGGKALSRPSAGRERYGAHFADLDDNVWQIVAGN